MVFPTRGSITYAFCKGLLYGEGAHSEHLLYGEATPATIAHCCYKSGKEGFSEGAIAGYLNGGTPRCFYREEGRSLPHIERPNGAGRGKAQRRTFRNTGLFRDNILGWGVDLLRYWGKSYIFASNST